MPRKKGHKRGAGKHATGQRKGKGASLRVVEQRDAAAAPAAAPPAAPAAEVGASAAQNTYVVGMAVEYESVTHKKWILTLVDRIDPDGKLVLRDRPFGVVDTHGLESIESIDTEYRIHYSTKAQSSSKLGHQQKQSDGSRRSLTRCANAIPRTAALEISVD